MTEGRSERRYTFVRVFSMLLASVLAAAIGLAGLAMWLPNGMTLGPAVQAGGNEDALRAIFVYLSAGPTVALGALILGWIVFIGGRPAGAIRLVFFPPAIWAVSVLAYFAIITAACDGHFTCGY